MERIIRVTGIGRLEVAPDTIEIGLNIKGSENKEAKALQKADERVALLKKELKKLGIEDEKIITRNFSISQYDKAYHVNYPITVSIDFNTKLLGEVMTSLSNIITGTDIRLNYVLKNQEGIKEKVVTNAVENAKYDAQLLANASGVKLGDIVSISHSFNVVRFNYGSSYDGARLMSKAKASAMDSMESFDDVKVDNLKFEASVNLEWEIK